jgi:hypothetical protein
MPILAEIPYSRSILTHLLLYSSAASEGGRKKIGIHPVTEVYKEKYAAKGWQKLVKCQRALTQKVLILTKYKLF